MSIVTVGELREALERLDDDQPVGCYLDGVQGEGAMRPRPILGTASVGGRLLLLVGKREDVDAS